MKKLSLFKRGLQRDEYFDLVEEFRNKNTRVGEVHHIVPRSLGGTNESQNLVRVPYAVHYKLHKLLVQIAKTSDARKKMNSALWLMSHTNTRLGRVKARLCDFSLAKEAWSQQLSVNNPMHRPEVVAKFVGRRRPEQVEVARAVNAKRKLPRVTEMYSCSYCKSRVLKTRILSKKKRPDWCCSRTCYQRNRMTAERIQSLEAYTMRKLAWDALSECERREARSLIRKRVIEERRLMGLPTGCEAGGRAVGSKNGKKGAAKLAKTASGRKRHYREDGSWTWSYS